MLFALKRLNIIISFATKASDIYYRYANCLFKIYQPDSEYKIKCESDVLLFFHLCKLYLLQFTNNVELT